MFMRGGEMQKIFFYLSRFIAKTTPTDMATGKAAGIAIVVKLRLRSMIFEIHTSSASSIVTVATMEAKERIAIMPINLMLSW